MPPTAKVLWGWYVSVRGGGYFSPCLVDGWQGGAGFKPRSRWTTGAPIQLRAFFQRQRSQNILLWLADENILLPWQFQLLNCHFSVDVLTLFGGCQTWKCQLFFWGFPSWQFRIGRNQRHLPLNLRQTMKNNVIYGCKNSRTVISFHLRLRWWWPLFFQDW